MPHSSPTASKACLCSSWLPAQSLDHLPCLVLWFGFPPAFWFHAWFQPRIILLSCWCLWLSHLYLAPNFHLVLILSLSCTSFCFHIWHISKHRFTSYPVSVLRAAPSCPNYATYWAYCSENSTLTGLGERKGKESNTTYSIFINNYSNCTFSISG